MLLSREEKSSKKKEGFRGHAIRNWALGGSFIVGWVLFSDLFSEEI